MAIPEKEYDQLLSEKENLLLKNERLKQELAEFKRLIFGSKSERLIPSEQFQEQLSLFENKVQENQIENTIRPLVIGRKNYMFAGSHEAAENYTMFYSFFATCKANNINHFEWINNVITRIPEHKTNKLDELLPHNWVKENNRCA